jgi:hypothetical protein
MMFGRATAAAGSDSIPVNNPYFCDACHFRDSRRVQIASVRERDLSGSPSPQTPPLESKEPRLIQTMTPRHKVRSGLFLFVDTRRTAEAALVTVVAAQLGNAVSKEHFTLNSS